MGQPPGQSGNPLGQRNVTRKRALNLAVVIREGVSPYEILEMLRTIVFKGIEPDTLKPVDIGTRLDALQIMLNRGWGQAAQHVIIEADVRQQLMGVEDTKLPATIEEVRAKREALRLAGARRKVIDAESTEARREMSLDEVNPQDDSAG